MSEGEVIAIGSCAAAGERLVGKTQVQLVAGRGIPGDRYAEQRGAWSGKSDEKRQLTLITAEGLAEARRQLGLDFDDLAARRNIVIRNFDLASCLGRKLELGTALIEVLLPCPPCDRLDRLVHEGLKSALADRGGVYARILESGEVAIGDHLRYADERPRRRLP